MRSSRSDPDSPSTLNFRGSLSHPYWQRGGLLRPGHGRNEPTALGGLHHELEQGQHLGVGRQAEPRVERLRERARPDGGAHDRTPGTATLATRPAGRPGVSSMRPEKWTTKT